MGVPGPIQIFAGPSPAETGRETVLCVRSCIFIHNVKKKTTIDSGILLFFMKKN